MKSALSLSLLLMGLGIGARSIELLGALCLSAVISSTVSVPVSSSVCQQPQGSYSTNPQSFIIQLGDNPQDDFADPRVFLDPLSGLYYAYATNNWQTNETNVPFAVSQDFRTGWSWYNYHDTFPHPGGWEHVLPGGTINLYDPSVMYFPSAKHYVMYYAAETCLTNSVCREHCIGTAISMSPTGPFLASPEPLICSNATYQHAHISPEVIQDDEQYYIVSKYGSGLAPGTHSEIWLAKIDNNGTTITSDYTNIYNSTEADDDAEGPNLLKGPDGTWFLFYVGGNSTLPDYNIRYRASTGNIFGPYDSPSRILLSTGLNNGVYVLSPGGPSFVNNTYMMFMGTVPQVANCTDGGNNVRGPRVAKLEYTGTIVTLAPEW